MLGAGAHPDPVLPSYRGTTTGQRSSSAPGPLPHLSNEEWVSETDPDARIARMKDGTTHLAYKPEHAIDLDTGAVVAAEVHAADEGDTTTITGTLDAARRNLTSVGAPPCSDNPAEYVVAGT